MNNSADEIFGTSPVNHCADPSQPEQIIRALKETGIFKGEFTAKRKDGSTFEVEMYARIAHDANGNEMYQGTSLDITERIEAEKAIKLNEERLRLSTESSGIAIWEYDYENNLMTRSSNHDQLYGFEQQEVWRIETFQNATHPDDRERSNEIIANALKPNGPDSYNFDFRVIWPDKQVRWLSVFGEVAERGKDGTAKLVRGTLIDITERKQAEDKLRESEEKFRELYDQSPVAIQYYDADGNLVGVNKKTLELYGIESYKEIAPYNFWHSNKLTEELIRDLKQGKPIFFQEVFDFEAIKKHGYFKTDKSGILHVELLVAPILSQGKAIAFLVHMLDVTEQKLAAYKLKSSEEKFRGIFEHSNIGIAIGDEKGNVMDVNKEYLAITGYSYEEFVGLNFAELSHPDD